MTHTGPFQPLPFCDSVNSGVWGVAEVMGTPGSHTGLQGQAECRKEGLAKGTTRVGTAFPILTSAHRLL